MPLPLPLSPFRSGPAGWSYAHWDGIVYPTPKPRTFHPLEFLSRFFDVVEINSSFYAPVRPEIARLWVSKVKENANFRFTAKLHRAFTHERRMDVGLVEQYHEGLRPLVDAKRLGCVLMQFPWSFRFTEENREHFIRLRRMFHAYPLVAEMRHASWATEEALGTFIDYHVGFANIDQPQHVKAMPPTAYLTSPIGYVRLHGRKGENWWQEPAGPSAGNRGDYLYSLTELAEWKERIQRIRSFASEVYVVANNDTGGRSVVNALQLATMVDGVRRRAPQEWHQRFGRELRGYVERPQQENLFEMPAMVSLPNRAVA